MQKFLFKSFLFILPVVIIFITIMFIDPFGKLEIINNNEDFFSIKQNVAINVNKTLTPIITYSKNPTELIILGDSRGNALSASEFQKITGLTASNLSVPGGTLAEIIDMFWFAVSKNEVEQVYFTLNFNLYDGDNDRNRIPETIDLSESYLRLLFSKYSIKASFLILRDLVSKNKLDSAPPMSREDFWQYQLDISAANFYENYAYPEDFYISLVEIDKYCAQHDIMLKFVVLPTHLSLQNRITDFILEKENLKFIEDLSSLGTVYNFDINSSLTLNKENFSDPFHFNSDISKIIIETITTDLDISSNVTGEEYFSILINKK